MVVNNSIQRFKDLGYSEYEARVYLALVKKSPLTPYEAAADASVPTSKVYEVLSRLEEKGLVVSHLLEGKKRFVPQPPKSLIGSLRANLTQTLDGLESDLEEIGSGESVSFLWNLSMESQTLHRVKDMVAEAKVSVLISLWKEDLDSLAPLLEAQKTLGRSVAAVVFGGRADRGFQIFPHPIEDTISEEKGGRGLTLVVDGQVALVCTLFGGNRAEGAWSANHGFVTLAEDYIKHDIYVTKIVERFDPELQRKFGPRYEYLRNVYQNQEVMK